MPVIVTQPTTKSTPTLGLPMQIPMNGDLSSIVYVLDALLHGGPKSASLATPPGGPNQGDVYIVAASPTGAWSGQAGSIAVCTPKTVNNGMPNAYTWEWDFIQPKVGMNLFVQDAGKFYVYNGTAWITEPVSFAASAPGTSAAAGTPGQFYADTGAIYICVATNTWRKVVTSTF